MFRFDARNHFPISSNEIHFKQEKPSKKLPSNQKQISIQGNLINYTLKHSAKRRIILSITSSGLIVNAPQNQPITIIENIIREKYSWIQKALNTLKQQLETTSFPVWKNGTLFPYLGKNCHLHLIQTNHFQHSYLYTDNRLIIKTHNTPSSIAKIVKEWLITQATDFLLTRLAKQANIMHLSYTSAKLSNAKTRWGSCTAQRHIRLNWRLIMIDLSLIDYVLIHELSHLIELNHSHRFWTLVERWYPNWKQARKNLRLAGLKCFTFFPD